MYKKSYFHLTSCMMSDTGHIFNYSYVCKSDILFDKIVKDKDVKHTIDEFGYPVSKVYDNKKHIMTFEGIQSMIYSDIELNINIEK